MKNLDFIQYLLSAVSVGEGVIEERQEAVIPTD
jgi:hypothetical protein